MYSMYMDLENLIANFRDSRQLIEDYGLNGIYNYYYRSLRKATSGTGLISSAATIKKLSTKVFGLTDEEISMFYCRTASDDLNTRVVEAIVAMQLLIEKSSDYNKDTEWWNYHLSADTILCLSPDNVIDATVH